MTSELSKFPWRGITKVYLKLSYVILCYLKTTTDSDTTITIYGDVALVV